MPLRGLFGALLAASLPLSAGPAAELARSIRENSLDSEACYRVRDFTLFQEDIRFYLTDGYLIFSKPVAGRPVAAVFSADVENGGGEVILRPPNVAERRSLASYTGSPNLDEALLTAVFFFTGDQYQLLIQQLPNNPTNRRVPEMGALLADKWNPVLRNLSASLDLRISLDLLNGPARSADFFAAAVQTSKWNNLNIFFDPDNADQIAAGQFTTRKGRTFFDIWTHFAARSAKGPAHGPLRIDLSDYRISATVDSGLNLTAVTKVKVKTATEGLRVLPFDIAREMDVSEVTVDGMPAEILEREEAVRSGITRGESSFFLVMPAAPLRAGVEHEFEFHHAGKAIVDAGDRVFYVTARGNWYPNLGPQLTTFDLTFRYPRDLELVTPGEVLEDRTEGEWRTTHRRPNSPIRMAGFNLGDYAHARVSRGGLVVDVCGNRNVEPALRPHPALPMPPPLAGQRRGRGTPPADMMGPPPPVVDPLARLERLASDIAGMLEFMSSKFGPPALPYLTVSPIPGNFGQGYPGLIYLSTRSYLGYEGHSSSQELFFDELLEVHETAHQWWGAQVTSAGYRDDWLMEALANYSALLYLEKTKGRRVMDAMLDEYRLELVTRGDNGEMIDTAGPIVMGSRLESSLEPRAWRAITYGKGSWIIHMLRLRMGDERFLSMLGEMIKQYGRGEITTENFRALASEFLPPRSDDPKLETFFDQWVYGTGIPSLKLAYTVKAKGTRWGVEGTLTQSDVPADFEALAPVEIQLPRRRDGTLPKPIIKWVRASDEPVTFTVDLPQAPAKVTLDPHNGVLRR